MSIKLRTSSVLIWAIDLSQLSDITKSRAESYRKNVFFARFRWFSNSDSEYFARVLQRTTPLCSFSTQHGPILLIYHSSKLIIIHVQGISCLLMAFSYSDHRSVEQLEWLNLNVKKKLFKKRWFKTKKNIDLSQIGLALFVMGIRFHILISFNRLIVLAFPLTLRYRNEQDGSSHFGSRLVISTMFPTCFKYAIPTSVCTHAVQLTICGSTPREWYGYFQRMKSENSTNC